MPKDDQTQAAEFYVDPNGSDRASGAHPDDAFATVTRARDAIRELKRAGKLCGPATVRLRGGVYRVTEPITFEPQDSGSPGSPITYTAREGERPVIDGGRHIRGWKPCGNGTWMAEVPDLEAGPWHFRHLYVNGEPRNRPRMPKEGFHRVAGFPEGTGKTVGYHTDCQSFEFAQGDINPDWTHIEDVEVIVYHFWTDSHLPIDSIDVEKRIVTFKHKAGKVFTDDFTEDGARYVVENAFEALTEPGEWYLNRHSGILYYIPMPDEDMAEAEVVAPIAPALIDLRGDPTDRQLVEHLAFIGLSFRHTHFELPIGNSNDAQGSASVPAAITLRGARHCSFDHCAVTHLGTSAFDLLDGCAHNAFRANAISHVAAGGFRANGGTEDDHPLAHTGHNLIADNLLHHYGETYPSAVGVLLMHTAGNRVEHNHIHHGWYTGISIGWVWGYQRSVSRDNVIEKNHIHHIGQGLLSDMGAIYTLGISPGTVLRGNLIHDVDANHYGGWGIYNDEGSSHILIEDNVVYDTKFAGYNIHYAKEVTLRNNIFALGRIQQLSRSRAEPHKSVFVEGNIVYWREGDLFAANWRDEPYEFHFHPKSHEGSRKATSTFDADYNLYYNPLLALDQVEFNGLSLDEWRQCGKDRHSLYADPMFVDPDARDFRLEPGSPALALGFRPIDLSDVGPREPMGPQA